MAKGLNVNSPLKSYTFITVVQLLLLYLYYAIPDNPYIDLMFM